MLGEEEVEADGLAAAGKLVERSVAFAEGE